jgi:hypothetical protein
MGFPSNMAARTTSPIYGWCTQTAIARFTAPVHLLGGVEGLSWVRGECAPRDAVLNP